MIIEEINYAGGQKSYKQNLTKFYKFFKSSPTVVICIRSEVTRRDFSNLQIYCVVELGLPLVPVRSIRQIPQLVQLYQQYENSSFALRFFSNDYILNTNFHFPELHGLD